MRRVKQEVERRTLNAKALTFEQTTSVVCSRGFGEGVTTTRQGGMDAPALWDGVGTRCREAPALFFGNWAKMNRQAWIGRGVCRWWVRTRWPGWGRRSLHVNARCWKPVPWGSGCSAARSIPDLEEAICTAPGATELVRLPRLYNYMLYRWEWRCVFIIASRIQHVRPHLSSVRGKFLHPWIQHRT